MNELPKLLDILAESNGSEEEPAEDLSWLKSREISELTTVQPEQILREVLYQACKLILMGGSKSFKTWTLMDVAFCIANGLLWWGTHTKKSVVVYLDFELLDYDFRWRSQCGPGSSFWPPALLSSVHVSVQPRLVSNAPEKEAKKGQKKPTLL